MTRLSDNAALNFLINSLNTGLPAKVVKKRVTFSTLTTGAVDTHDLFTVSGAIACTVIGVCRTDLAGAGATIEVGIVGTTAGIIAETAGTNIDEDEIWISNAPAKIFTLNNTNFPVRAVSADIKYTIKTAAVSGGVIDFYCLYSAITEDGAVQ